MVLRTLKDNMKNTGKELLEEFCLRHILDINNFVNELKKHGIIPPDQAFEIEENGISIQIKGNNDTNT
tara:strand:- start:155 stop:358 length:204 start_codon:yes stop_codon:yes gene_type:complete